MIFLLTSIYYNTYASAEGHSANCRTSLSEELVRGNGCYQNVFQQDSFLEHLQQESFQKVEALQKNPAFQEVVAELQNSASKDVTVFTNPNKESKGALYVFISFSMGEKAFLNLAHETKQFNATLVLRGFKDGSYVKTAQALQKIITNTGQGILIDPELYTLFNVKAVPTYVLAKPFTIIAAERTQTPIHDKLQGHVSVQYALEAFVKEGDLKAEAQALLKRGSAP